MPKKRIWSDLPQCAANGCTRTSKPNSNLCQKCRTEEIAVHGRLYRPGKVLTWLQEFVKSIPSDDPTSACIPWPHRRNANGYGTIKVMNKSLLAHRVTWELLNGNIPNGLLVLHKCNNGHLGCFNPSHLKIGDYQDNSDDTVLAGRQARNLCPGELHSQASFTNQQVEEILLMHQTNGPASIARKFGSTLKRVSAVLTGVSWATVSMQFYLSNPEMRPNPNWLKRHGQLYQALKSDALKPVQHLAD
jgi:hypothetical protein